MPNRQPARLIKTAQGLTDEQLGQVNGRVQTRFAKRGLLVPGCSDADFLLACQQTNDWWSAALNEAGTPIDPFTVAIGPKLSTGLTEEGYIIILTEVQAERLKSLEA